MFKTRIKKPVRTPAEIESTMRRWSLRSIDRLPKSSRFVSSLKSLDATVASTRDHITYLVKTKKDPASVRILSEVVPTIRSNMVETLTLFIEDREFRGMGPLQVKSAEVFRDKISRAKTGEELLKALEYFNSNSCMLKLSTR